MLKQFSICTAALLLAGTLTMQAQEKKNLVGGNIGYYTGKSKNDITDFEPKSNTLNANLMYAHYLGNRLALGLKIGFYHDQSEYVVGATPEIVENKTNRTTLSPFLRYDVPLWKSKFSIYNDFGIGATFGRSDLEANNQDMKVFGVQAFYEPGLQYRLNKHIGLQASFGNLFSAGYSSNKDEIAGSETSNTYVGIDGRFGISSFLFGINLFF